VDVSVLAGTIIAQMNAGKVIWNFMEKKIMSITEIINCDLCERKLNKLEDRFFGFNILANFAVEYVNRNDTDKHLCLDCMKFLQAIPKAYLNTD